MVNQILSCDWGTSSFRLRLINLPDGTIHAESKTGKGIAIIYNEWLQSGKPEKERIDFYREILQSQIYNLSGSALKGLPVVISGMASSSIGIKEMPYCEIPFNLKEINLNIFSIPANEKFQNEMILISGIRTPNDIMRGEETILTGCLTDESLVNQLFIFPGTHSKHVVVQNGLVRDIKTYMTGELFELLSTKSILARSVERTDKAAFNFELFTMGVQEAAANNLLNSIFHIRTKQLFGELNKQENYYYLSGLLIGEEMKNLKDKNLGSVTLVSSGILSDIYRSALSLLGINAEVNELDAEKAFIRGQILIFNHLLNSL